MFFDTWFGLARAAVVGVLAYVGLVAFLRLSGKRTLAKMSAFDLVVSVALGSTLATVLLTKDVALLEGLAGFAVLILMQFVVAWLSIRSAAFRRLVRSEPALLYFRGRFLDRSLKSERVTESEVYQAVRADGYSGMDDVEAVVLESDGSFSVVTARGGSDLALADVPGATDPLEPRAVGGRHE
jgi:uncharacterized membrane protein YcaP (DUF421 family)